MKNTCIGLAIIAVALAIAACSKNANSEVVKDWGKVCNAFELSGAAAIDDPSERAVRVAEWIEKNISSSEVQATMGRFASTDHAEREPIVHEELAKHGITDCPFLDLVSN